MNGNEINSLEFLCQYNPSLGILNVSKNYLNSTYRLIAMCSRERNRLSCRSYVIWDAFSVSSPMQKVDASDNRLNSSFDFASIDPGVTWLDISSNLFVGAI